jgi:hypothetical protein
MEEGLGGPFPPELFQAVDSVDRVDVMEEPAENEGHDTPVLFDHVEYAVLVAAELLQGLPGEVGLEDPTGLVGLGSGGLVDEPPHQLVDSGAVLGVSLSDRHF